MAPHRRSGFSLIELLVVMGLLVIIASIGVASFAGTQRVSRLVGTEQLVAAMIRQARQTARATGQAVLLYVDPQERTIAGVRRLPMWQSACEQETSGLAAGANPTLIAGTTLPITDWQQATGEPPVLGRTGRGMADLGTAADPATVTLFDPTAPAAGRNRQLTRRPAGQPTEGFQLGAVVRAQAVYDPADGTSPSFVPLLAISQDPAGTVPDTDKAFAGLLLHRAYKPMYDTPPEVPHAATGTTTLTGFNFNPERPLWEVVGWVLREGSTTPDVVSSLTDAVNAGGAVGDARQLDPLVGGRWTELSLVFTGSTLELQRDGRQIAWHKLDDKTVRLAGYGQAHVLHIGAVQPSAGFGGSGSAVRADRRTVFDDIQLVRLGVDEPQRFPGGVAPKKPYRLLAHPDGRLSALATLNAAADALTGTDLVWTFSGVSEEADDLAELRINPTSGVVSATQVALTRSAP